MNEAERLIAAGYATAMERDRQRKRREASLWRYGGIAGVLIILGWLGSTRQPTPLSAENFTVAVVAGRTAEESSLVGARDAAVSHLRSALPDAWRRATRGLGTLSVVERDAGIQLNVLAASGTSVHRSGRRTQDVLLYVAEEGRRVGASELVSTALHELGHIWCCNGEGTSEGHWISPSDEGRDASLNRHGLMTSPVNCNVQADREWLCPDQFSERELRAMGFTTVPAITAAPCVREVDAVKATLDTLEASLATRKRRIDADRVELRETADEISAIESRYRFTGIPRSIYGHYSDLIDRHNELVENIDIAVGAHNRLVAAFNTTSTQHTALAARCLAR